MGRGTRIRAMQLPRFRFTIGQLIKLIAASAFCLVPALGLLAA